MAASETADGGGFSILMIVGLTIKIIESTGKPLRLRMGTVSDRIILLGAV